MPNYDRNLQLDSDFSRSILSMTICGIGFSSSVLSVSKSGSNLLNMREIVLKIGEFVVTYLHIFTISLLRLPSN